MFPSDHVTAKILFEERLREAAEKRCLRRLEASRSAERTPLLEKFGDLLITLGTNLKTIHPKLA